MALRRMISTRFFKDPDIMNLSSKDAQLILIGLVLAADDEGRAVAHAGLLGREIDFPPEQIETALQELADNDLLVLYQVGKHRYYQLTRIWNEWQTLGGRITPSRYPAPPVLERMDERQETPRKQLEDDREDQGNFPDISPCLPQHFPDQEKRSESKRKEDEGEVGAQAQQTTPEAQERKVVPFPTLRAAADDGDQSKDGMTSEEEQMELVRQIARILKLPATDALARLVAEYAPLTSLSLPGEADAAREWIDDSKRNRAHKQMSPAFFRNWLKREQESLDRRQQALQMQTMMPTGTTGSAISSPSPTGGSLTPRRLPDLMHLADEDRYTEQEKGNAR